MRIEDFKDLDCWKKARELVGYVYYLTKGELFSRDFGLRDQIQRAAVSVMANIAEGFGTRSDIEFVRYLSMAIRSAFEVQSHIYVALDLGYIGGKEFERAEQIAKECVNLSKGLIRYLKEK